MENQSLLANEQPAPSTTSHLDDDVINRTVLVSNISPSATNKTVTDFFAFCGTIKTLTMRNQKGSTDGVQEAVIEFKQEAATKTALLLTNAIIVDRPITVAKYKKHEEATSSGESARNVHVYSEDQIENKPHNVPADQRSQTSVIASLVAAGYKLGEDTVATARQIDEKHSISANISASADVLKLKVAEIDHNYKISETTTAYVQATKDKIAEVDKKLGISDGAAFMVQSADALVKSVGENPTVQSTVTTLKNTGTAVSNYATDLTQEAAKVIEEKPTLKAAAGTISKATKIVKDEYNSVVEQTNTLIAQQKPAATESEIHTEQNSTPDVTTSQAEEGKDDATEPLLHT